MREKLGGTMPASFVGIVSTDRIAQINNLKP